MILIRYCILSMFVSFTASAQPFQFKSSDRQTSLVELYTSEGCSSCPPAESCLSGLKAAPGLWSDFVPVAFHVDYWDYLGWRDRWSSKQFSDRQRDYSQAWGSESIYTPGFVLNGQEWRNWYEQRAKPPISETKAGLLSVSSEDGVHWQVNFTPAATGGSRYDAHAALLASELSSDVKAGENAGRRLKHDFAALTLIKLPLTAQNDTIQGTFDVETRKKTLNGRLALAVWVTRAGHIEPTQAVGGWLLEPEKK